MFKGYGPTCLLYEPKAYYDHHGTVEPGFRWLKSPAAMSGGGYCCRSSGNVTDAVIKTYIAPPAQESGDMLRIEWEVSLLEEIPDDALDAGCADVCRSLRPTHLTTSYHDRLIPPLAAARAA
jgi:hypothetical protein